MIKVLNSTGAWNWSSLSTICVFTLTFKWFLKNSRKNDERKHHLGSGRCYEGYCLNILFTAVFYITWTV